MDESRKQFESVLAEFSETSGYRVALDAHDGFTVTIGDTCFNGTYLPASEQIVVWCDIGALGDDAAAGARALWMLRRHDAWAESHGCTYGMDPKTRVATVADRRSVRTVYSADVFAAWIMGIGEEVNAAWSAMESLYPYVDDEPYDEEDSSEPMIREIAPDGKEVL